MPAQNQPSSDLVADFHLLGKLDFNRYQRLQRRLIYEAASDHQPRMTVLMCEHNELITIGRRGSRAHIRRTNEELRRAQLGVQWVNRSGGCILHGPGQLAVYPLVPLHAVDWTVRQFLDRFQSGLQAVLDDLKIATHRQQNSLGVWGRTGLLATFGVVIQDGVTGFGAAINVNPPMGPYGFVDTAVSETLPTEAARTMGCLFAERRLPVRMSSLRSALVSTLVESFSCARHNVYAGHPWLRAAV